MTYGDPLRATTFRLRTRRGRESRDVFVIKFEGEAEPVDDSEAIVVGSCSVSLETSDGPFLIYESGVTDPPAGTLELVNLWPTASQAPRSPTREISIRPGSIDDDSFWRLMEGNLGDSANIRLNKIRLRLAKEPLETVLAFQRSIYEKASRLVEATGGTWSATVGVLLSGRRRFDDVLARKVELSRQVSGEFADLTDLAEEAIGAQIEVGNFGTSRSVEREVLPVQVPGMTPDRVQQMFGMPPSAWDQLPWRWTGFRALVSRAGELNEVIAFANRPWGVSVGAHADVVRDFMTSLGSIASSLEWLDPELRRPHRKMPPAYYISTRV